MATSYATVTTKKGTSKTKNTKKKTKKPKFSKLQTKVALVIDESGSMLVHKDGVIKMFDAQIAQLKEKDPTAEISLFYFASRNEFKDNKWTYSRVRHILDSVGVSQLHNLSPKTYQPQGNTPLFDAVKEATEKLQKQSDKNTAYLMLVLTDGHENDSLMTQKEFANLIKTKQASDVWTFAVMVPKGYKDRFASFSGIHPGNITEWEHTGEAQQAVTQGTQTYYAARSVGQRSVSSFFTTDLSGVKVKDFKSLPTLQGVKVWNVEKEIDIKSFVETHKGVTFHIGAGYYQLTKPEEISPQKEVLVMKKGDSVVKSNGRDLLRLPTGTVKVKPGNHADFDIFVQSTSNNRKLVRGTRFVYKV